ncbi:MAG: hypothetical protein AB1345_06230 [Chloroflexota bacterium]
MNKRNFSNELILYLLAFLLAVGVRLINLGLIPLSDVEASWALQALALVRGEEVLLGPQPGYVLPTAFLFFLFGTNAIMARLWPVLAGSALVWVPYLWRDRLGRVAGLILAFGLALDPGLVALSRVAGSPLLAVAFTLFALTALWSGSAIWTGIWGAWALLSGTAIWPGVIGLATTLGVARALGPVQVESPDVGTVAGVMSDRDLGEFIRKGLIAGGTTLLVVGTMLFFFPNGINAMVGSLPAYLRGWGTGGGEPASHLLMVLCDQSLAIVFGVVGAIVVWRERHALGRWLCLWWVVATGLALAYPARDFGDLAWSLVPLWSLAGIGLARIFRRWRHSPVEWGLAALTLVLFAFGWLDLVSLGRTSPQIEMYRLRWIALGGVVVIQTLSFLLVSLGWSLAEARRGFAFGFGVGLALLTVSASFGASQLRSQASNPLWRSGDEIVQADLLLQTLGELSKWRTGDREAVNVVVVDVDSPALRWVLRDFTNARFQSGLETGAASEVIVLPKESGEPRQTAMYRGQDFAWRSVVIWNELWSTNILRWLTQRELPTRTEALVLWVRGDLFPNGEITVESETHQPVEEPLEEPVR